MDNDTFCKDIQGCRVLDFYHGLCLETNLEIGMVKHVSNPTWKVETYKVATVIWIYNVC